MNTYELLRSAVAADPGRPLITMYDDATGERVELSVATVDNWVAKTANLLMDELMLEEAEPVGIQLPPHWQTGVIQLAVLAAGGRITAGPARIVFWLEGTPLPDDPLVEEIVGLSLRPMGQGLSGAVAGVLDYAVDVRAHGDRFVTRYLGAQIDPTPIPERVISDRLDILLVPLLAGGGSLVLCRHLDAASDPAAVLARRAETEHATLAIGLDVPGLPRRR